MKLRALATLFILGLMSGCGGGSGSGSVDSGNSSSSSSASSVNISSISSSSLSSISSSSNDSSEGADQALINQGKTIYEQSLSYGNNFACANCHALQEPASDNLRRPGHPIGNALRRPSYKNSQLGGFIEAANTCLTEWMNVDINSNWNEGSDDYLALIAYLGDRDTGQGEASAVSFTISSPSPGDFEGGDVALGKQIYDRTCIVCHGDNISGTSRGPQLFGTNPDAIAARVRLSGKSDSLVYSGLTGGSMPFWSAERLSDEELSNIAAYVKDTVENRNTNGGNNGGGNNNDGGNGGGSGCTANHPRVGQVATLIQRSPSYGVEGQARVVDDCTIRFENFSYFGNGIRVRVFGAKNGNYGGSDIVDMILPGDIDNLRGMSFSNETLEVTIPDGFTLDDFDGVSIWCTGIRESFGDGLFETPMQSFITQ